MSAGLDALIAAAAKASSGEVALFADRPYAELQPKASLPASRLSLAIVVWPVDVDLLAALRDQWAERVVLFVPESDDAQHFTALGFTPSNGGGGYRQFDFDIVNYKNTPDWLNAKGWANPQNWDKFRW